MRRLLLALLVLGSAQALNAQTETPEAKPAFQPAGALSVTDIPAPDACTAIGTMVLNALINEKGEVREVEIRRDIDCFSQGVVHTVKDWKFSPATLAGKAIASRILVAVTFNPPIPFADPVPLPPLIPQTESAIQAELQPAEVTRAPFPHYPPATVLLGGTTVLEVTLSAKGEAGEIKALLDLAPLTESAKAVVADWRFMPAAYNGHAIESKIVLAFVLRVPVTPGP